MPLGRPDVEAIIRGILLEQGNQSMRPGELVSRAIQSGISEMDARDALLSMLAADRLELTHEREIRLEEAVAA